MVSLSDAIEKTAAELPKETFDNILNAVSEVIHRLPQTILMNDTIRDALRTGDKQACDDAEFETFPALLTGIRRVTGSDLCVLNGLVKIFGAANLDKTMQACALGQLLAFECILEYIRKNKAGDEIAQLNRMFGIDTPNESSDNEDRRNAA